MGQIRGGRGERSDADELPGPRIWGKTNHIQWLRFRPARSSLSAASKTGSCAVTKRSRSNLSVSLVILPEASPTTRHHGLCIGYLDPGGGMIAGVFAAPHLTVDPGRHQPIGNKRTEQQMIDAKPGIAGKCVSEVFPERVDPLMRMQRPQRGGPPLVQQADDRLPAPPAETVRRRPSALARTRRCRSA